MMSEEHDAASASAKQTGFRHRRATRPERGWKSDLVGGEECSPEVSLRSSGRRRLRPVQVG